MSNHLATFGRNLMKPRILATLVATAAVLAPAYGTAQEKKEEAKSPHTVTGNVGFVSEYRYRGISQTNFKPALQGGIDYAHESGLYLGTWASNVNWLSDAGASNSMEWDFYGGYKGSAGDFSYDVGGLYYYYPGKYPTGFTKPDTFEIYGAGTWKMLTLKYSHALTNIFGFPDSKGGGYLDLTGTFEVAEGTNVVAHVGYQTIPASSANARVKSDCSYADYKLGITKDAAGFTWGAAYIGTNAKGDAGQCYRNVYNKDLGKGTVVLSVLKTF
jgi:uncharacterized protein (TIGR02001 family)